LKIWAIICANNIAVVNDVMEICGVRLGGLSW